MSNTYFFSKATCDDETGWNFDSVEQPGAPFCITDADLPEFVDGDVPLLLDGQQVSLKPQYVPGTAVLAVSSFDSAAVVGPSFDPNSGCCVSGVQNVPCQTLTNEMCPEEPAQPLSNVLRVTVTGSGTGDGSSWENASTLESALSSLGVDVEIWLQAGTYSSSSTPYRYFVSESFRLYGGFVGTETSRAQRPSQTAATLDTILTGSGVSGVVDIAPNAGGLTVLDSLSIQDGSEMNGGGISMTLSSELIVRNCLLSSHEATLGGAVYASNSADVTLCYCVISNNFASDGGGAIYSTNASSLQCFNCSLRQNSSTNSAGAVEIVGAVNVLFINCAFFDNSSALSPGGAYFGPGTNVSLLQCSFAKQIAPGASSSGAILGQASTIDIRNSIFWANSGTFSLDVISAVSSVVSVCNYMASDTDAASFGTLGPSTITLTNRIGGPAQTDPLFVNDVTGDLRLTALSAARDSGDNNGLLFRDCANSVPVGVSINVDLDRFARVFTDTVDLGAYEFKTEKWQFFVGTKSLLANAMCPEEGTPAAENILYVKVVATGAGDGSSWANAATLTAALASAMNGQELWLQSGTYDASTDGTYTVKVGVRLYGGFVGDTETLRSQRDSNPATNGTICTGAGSTTVFRVDSGGGSTDGLLSVIDGLNIVQGSSVGRGGGISIRDATQSDIIVRNCVLDGNIAAEDGGAIDNDLDAAPRSLVICDSVLSRNTCNGSVGGGAVFLSDIATVRFYNVSMFHNVSSGVGTFGGAVRLQTIDDALLINCVFWRNTAASGGALFALRVLPGLSTFSAIQCTVVENEATENLGGGFRIVAAGVSPIVPTVIEADVRNTIFYNNMDVGGTVSQPDKAVDLIVNTAVFVPGSMPVARAEVCTYMASLSDMNSFRADNAATLTLSDSQGNNVDPLFVDPSQGDLRLTKASTARDSGNNEALVDRDCGSVIVPLGVDVNVDLQRIQRIVNTTVDIGAYEWAPDVDCFEVLLSWDGTGPQPCVHGDTLLTVKDRGFVQIRDVKSGDFVLTRQSLDEEPQYVEVSFNVVIHVPKTRFVKFPVGSLGENCPNETLLVRNGHPLLTAEGEEKFSQDFVDGKTIVWLQDNEVRKVYTLATKDWTFANMNGALVKTWDAAGFAYYASNDECGKRLFYTKQ